MLFVRIRKASLIVVKHISYNISGIFNTDSKWLVVFLCIVKVSMLPGP